MTGWVEKHNGSYRYRIELNKDLITNKRKTISKSGFKLKKDATKALNQKLVEINDGKYIEDKKISVEYFLTEWIESYKNNIAPSTFKRYKEFCTSVNNHIGSIELLKLTPIIIQGLYTELLNKGLSKSTVLKVHRCLKLALKQAVGWNMLNSNPCDNVKPPRPDKVDIQIWDESTTKRFLFLSRDEGIYIVIAIALGTGMREGEICALKWDCVDLKNGEIYVKRSLQNIDGVLTLKEPKTKGSIRRISIAPDLVNVLKEYKKYQTEMKMLNRRNYTDDNFVCTWEDGRPYAPLYIAKKFPLLISKYNVPKIRFHDLRHTHATILLLHDVPAKIVSERLGHSTISITLDTYSHVLPSMQRAAAEKLNGLFGAL
ncbi:MAG: tyrosine-type recombinase/integrase [Clostridium sp.]|uniref:site-specific integrase n=1 Tax=Clostridium sp. TaxID=1506 RepID=UPI0030652AAC